MSTTTGSASASTTATANLAFPSIAVAWALNLVPHTYYFVKMMSASNYTATNITPRTNLDTLKVRGLVPAATWAALARARGAHLNAIEGFPLFAACMIAGTVAKLPPRELNTLAAEYIGARALYTALYMTVRSERASYLRTAVWYWSVAIPIYGLIRAGRACNDDGRGL